MLEPFAWETLHRHRLQPIGPGQPWIEGKQNLIPDRDVAGWLAIVVDMSGFEVCQQIKSNPHTSSTLVLHLSGHFVRSEDRVDEVLDEAKKAGGKILKPAAKLQWGGYGGSFADPDGYIWNVGYSAEGKDQPYAE